MAFGRPGEQLRLFAPASEIMGGLLGGDLDSYEGRHIYGGDMTRMMRQKAQESKLPGKQGHHGGGVYESIKKHGFRGHIQIDLSNDRPQIWEGHHRLAAATMAEQSGYGNQWVGLDYVENNPQNGGVAERFKPSYTDRYRQNVPDEGWRTGYADYDTPRYRP